MSNGQQLAEKNFLTFTRWVDSKDDEEFRSIVHRGVISRKLIAEDCGFAKSALSQNPRIKAALCELEERLRSKDILPPLLEKNDEVKQSAPLRENFQPFTTKELKQLHHLQKENESLNNEMEKLKKTLEGYAMLQKALLLTGRILR